MLIAWSWAATIVLIIIIIIIIIIINNEMNTIARNITILIYIVETSPSGQDIFHDIFSSEQIHFPFRLTSLGDMRCELGYGLNYPGFDTCRGSKFSPPRTRDPLQGPTDILLGEFRGLFHRR